MTLSLFFPIEVMIRIFRGLSLAGAGWLILSASLLSANAAEEIVFRNLHTNVTHYVRETREYGDQLQLAGDSRVVTRFTFGYTGGFTVTGDEQAIIRFYSNDRPYDMFRQQPGTLLWESGYFPIAPGNYQIKTLQVSTAGSDIVVPDIFTWTVEFAGLASGENAGLLLYPTPSVGSSFGEYWIRTGPNQFENFEFPNDDPYANFLAEVLAVPEPGVTALLGLGGLFFLRQVLRPAKKRS